jgi:twitching motility two-component system response regulator PilH
MGILDQLRAILGKSETSATSLNADVTPLPLERRCRPRVNAREGTRVLIIDDSPTILAVFRKILRTAGYVTQEALDAERGVEIARSDRPDLIFLDIVLPGMNGFAALRHLRRDPQTRDIPIIMISGNEQATEQFFGTRIGADDFMKKPFSRFEIFARIERLLDENLIPRRAQLNIDSAPVSTPPGNVPHQQRA